MSVFLSKKQVKVFVCEHSVTCKKPFVIDQSDKRRFIVKCPEILCTFAMWLHGNANGVFELVLQQEHNCNAALPTITRAWVTNKTMELLAERQKVPRKEHQDILRTTCGVRVNPQLLTNALADAKRRLAQDTTSFGRSPLSSPLSRRQTKGRRRVC